jgi:SAM-dependent methyltransferase
MPRFSIATISRLARRPISENIDALSWFYHRAELLMFIRRHSLDLDGFISSSDLITDSTESLVHSNNYRPYSNYHLKLLLREALATGIEFDNFIDVGCGKGQPCIFARKYFGFPKVYGIDFSEPLIQVARQNVARIGYKDMFFLVADAAKWRAPAGNTLFFLFNPFDALILEEFLRLNLQHFVENRSLIAYAADDHRETMLKLGFEIVFRAHRLGQSILRYKSSQ